MKAIENLTDHFLIATSNAEGSFFEEGLIYICTHAEDLTFGLMINQPMIEVSFNDILEAMPDDMDVKGKSNHIPAHIFAGGPVENEQGFVLHSGDYSGEKTVEIAPNISLTASLDIIKAITDGTGPEHYNFCLGYSGWSPHQLEQEIADNHWMVVPADPHILFHLEPEKRYASANAKLGLSASTFHEEAGLA